MNDRWISFDCFGTLVDWNGGFHAILRPIAGSRTGDLVSAYHRHERRIEQEAYRKYRDVTRIALERAAQEISCPLAAHEVGALASAWNTLPVFEDTAPVLRRLHEEGWSIAVLTNCDDDLFAVTREQLGETVDMVVTAERVRSYKPALEHFAHFRGRIGPSASWVHAACSWFHDIAPARALGVPRIWIDRDRTGEDPAAATAVLPDLRGLAATVQALH